MGKTGGSPYIRNRKKGAAGDGAQVNEQQQRYMFFMYLLGSVDLEARPERRAFPLEQPQTPPERPFHKFGYQGPFIVS